MEPAPERLRQMLVRFHAAVTEVRRRHELCATPEAGDEHDVYDLLHGLLVLNFACVRADPRRTSDQGDRLDFFLEQERVVVAVKKPETDLSVDEITRQMNEDVARYRTHPACDHLVWFIYDPDRRIGNPCGLARIHHQSSDLDVEVILSPPVP